MTTANVIHYKSHNCSEFSDQGVHLSSELYGVAVTHGQVDLSTVAPQCGRVGRRPGGKQPGEENRGGITISCGITEALVNLPKTLVNPNLLLSPSN